MEEHALSELERKKSKILVVEDDDAVARLLCSILEHSGFSVRVCTNPYEFESIADSAQPELVITDLTMPGRNGMEILRVIASRYPGTSAIVLTGDSEISNAVGAMQLGALDYVVKPVSGRVLNAVVTGALARRRSALDQKRDAERIIAIQRQSLVELQQLLWRGSEATLAALSTALDARERATAGHSERVSRYAADLARRAGVPDSKLYAIRVGALLHDIGKIGIPDSILLKSGKLSADEWEIMRSHPKVGFQILSPLEQFRDAADLVLLHHERWDGTGYPNGVSGDRIPVGARIFAVVDAFDAITSDRPYRRRSSVPAALREIESGAGTQFDPDLARLFIAHPPAQPGTA